ncbi:synaptobrevin [Piedraia hortae CBS 480.64]|uniref:Synaptobrevin n=1 Tax=Piedraia hortae CBS 480.64 TaxID=1314780 RepID=A0A6A7BSY9_9PEZI|nr:synaptobrevin [Piedraia hortae CBS 480.64]
MSHEGGLYDPPTTQGGNDRISQLQREIDEAKRNVQQNIQRTAQRGENIDRLQNKTDALADSAGNFHRGASKVRKQMWWKDMKMRLCILIGIIVLLIVIIVPSGKLVVAAETGSGANDKQSSSTNTTGRKRRTDQLAL